MNYFTWEDPPAAATPKGRDVSKGVAAAMFRIAASGQIGRWAKLDPDICGTQPGQVANRIKNGNYVAGAGRWDAISRQNRTYVRFLGFDEDKP